MVRSFAIVPAAGRSVRMGRPKLLLPLGDRTVIEHVLAAWTASRVTRTVVVLRGDNVELAARCTAYDVDIVTPAIPPSDMKASIACALAHVGQRYAPKDADAWLVAPADMPRLPSLAIDRVLSAYDPAEPSAVVPTFRGACGHPVLLPWSLAHRLHELSASEGLGSLVARTPRRHIDCDMAGILCDVDGPADYARLLAQPAHPVNLETGPSGSVF